MGYYRYIVLQSYNHIDKNYLRWLLFQFDVSHMKTLGAGVRQTVNFTDIGNSYCYMPTKISEQKSIAKFLDNATSKIDTLISKQHDLIKLLKEKRQAVISHAVTKGLDPTVEFKDSGVEWLGDVPSGWGVKKLRYNITSLESGTSVNASDVSATKDEFGVLKTSSVYTGKFRAEENKTVLCDEIDRLTCPLKLDTLIVSRMNTPELVGAAGYVESAPTNIYLPDRLWQVSFSCNTKLVHYFTLSTLYRNYIRTVCDGTSSSMQNLAQENFKDFVFTVSPFINEQKKIADYLDDKTSKIDLLVIKSTQSIELLKEKRTALISAAVTGKIDVRGVA